MVNQMSNNDQYIMDDPREAGRLADKVNAAEWVEKYLSPHLECAGEVLDVGCGPATIATQVAKRWPNARVTGVELNDRKLDTTTTLPPNLVIRSASALSLPFPDSQFDLVYCRFLLEYLGDKAKAIREMVRVCRPGGTVILQDLDGQMVWHYPPDESLDESINKVITGLRKTGFDPFVGRKLFSLAQSASLIKLQVKAESYHLFAGAIDDVNFRLWELKLDIVRPAAAKILGSDAEAATLKTRYLNYLRRTDTLTYSTVFTVSGVKPESIGGPGGLAHGQLPRGALTYEFAAFGIHNLAIVSKVLPKVQPNEVIVDIKAWSLNFRDILIVNGLYNPNLPLPAVPLSDGAGVVSEVGDAVIDFKVGDRVVTHCISGWQDGPYRERYLDSMLGQPFTGVAGNRVLLPVSALVPMPLSLDFPQAATLGVAALTAWGIIVNLARLQRGDTLLTLGTGGVSIFALQFANAMGIKTIVTSSDDAKLSRAIQLGAHAGINYRANADWDQKVLEITNGEGVNLVLETSGPGTLTRSLNCAKSEGVIAVFGVQTGAEGTVSVIPMMKKRLKVIGVNIDSRSSFLAMNQFIDQFRIVPIVDRVFQFDQLPQAIEYMAQAKHFGKLVLV
jgi:NADPH:quinone reductase-like Zn-dependent oxidoreductase/SAM-dependent methyltransferase